MAEALVKKKLMLEGLDCANCAMKIEKGVGNIEGVNSCSVNFATKTMILETAQNKRKRSCYGSKTTRYKIRTAY